MWNPTSAGFADGRTPAASSEHIARLSEEQMSSSHTSTPALCYRHDPTQGRTTDKLLAQANTGACLSWVQQQHRGRMIIQHWILRWEVPSENSSVTWQHPIPCLCLQSDLLMQQEGRLNKLLLKKFLPILMSHQKTHHNGVLKIYFSSIILSPQTTHNLALVLLQHLLM